MRLFRKIDFYFADDYLGTTQQSKTCKEARAKYLESLESKRHALGGLSLVESRVLKAPEQLKARYRNWKE